MANFFFNDKLSEKDKLRGRLTKRKMIFKFSGLGMKNNRPRKQQARSINNFSAQTQFDLWGTNV